MSTPKEIANKCLDDFVHFVRDPEKRTKQLIRKITHSGEIDLNKGDLNELKKICKVSNDELMVSVYKECMKCLRKSHSQVRLATLKLIDYLFGKSHLMRRELLNEFDIFLELTLAITQKPKVQFKLPPPKKYAALLQELGAKFIHQWHADFGEGYEKLRYAYKFLREHGLVDFNRFQVNAREQLIKQQKIAEQQDKILTRAVENRLKEFRELRPEMEKILAQIQSLIDILVPIDDALLQPNTSQSIDECCDSGFQHHGIANLSQNIDIEFGAFMKIIRNDDNKDVVNTLKELKRELIDVKLTKLIAIEKTLHKRSDEMLDTLQKIIDLKNRATNLILKLGDLQIITNDPSEFDRTKSSILDNADSDSDEDSEFDEVQPKDGLESYIPKSMRSEYGLESIDPRENRVDENRVSLSADTLPSTSKADQSDLIIACNVRLETGKLCPRRDRVKCPFHGKIIPRDQLGVPLDEQDRLSEQAREKKLKDKKVPEWQDPQLLAEIKAAVGVDLTMPSKGRRGNVKSSTNNLADTRTCDLTPKQRLHKKLRLIAR